MTASFETAAIALLVGGGCLVVGALVRYRGWVSLVSGVPVVEGAEAAAATVVGNVLVTAGVGLALLSGLLALGADRAVPAWLLGAGLAVAVAIVAPRLGPAPGLE